MENKQVEKQKNTGYMFINIEVLIRVESPGEDVRGLGKKR